MGLIGGSYLWSARRGTGPYRLPVDVGGKSRVFQVDPRNKELVAGRVTCFVVGSPAMFGQQVGQRLIDNPLGNRLDDYLRWNGHFCLNPGPVGAPGHEIIAVEGAIPHPDRSG